MQVPKEQSPPTGQTLYENRAYLTANLAYSNVVTSLSVLTPHTKPYAWLSLCTLFALASAAAWCLPVALQDALRWQADGWTRQPWTLWTAALVHLSATHLAANMLALAALAVTGHRMRLPAQAAVALVVAWPLTTLGLLYWPQITSYAGFSGLNHAVASVVIAQAAIKKIAYPLSFVLLAGLGLKLLSEHAWSQPVVFSADWGFAVVQAAHLSGAAAGLVCAVALHVVGRVR